MTTTFESQLMVNYKLIKKGSVKEQIVEKTSQAFKDDLAGLKK